MPSVSESQLVIFYFLRWDLVNGFLIGPTVKRLFIKALKNQNQSFLQSAGAALRLLAKSSFNVTVFRTGDGDCRAAVLTAQFHSPEGIN